MQNIPRTSIRELAHKIKSYGAPRFAFFLGAGASRQSGVLTAGEMIRHFKEQIVLQRGPEDLKTEEEKAKWLSEQDWYLAEGSEYCKCFESFERKEIGRQRYIERIVEKGEPSFGYVVLANLMAQGLINTIITTNFDDLVYSACTTFTGIRPIVYAYGLMASEMRFTAQRPKILKLHGDYLYSALKNTGEELAAQDPNMVSQLRQVLSEYGLIVIGYSGGDKSVMQALSEISHRQDLYWCIRRGEKQLHEDVKKLLREKDGHLVEIDGFDEMMNEVRRVVEFDVKKMLGSIEERRGQLIKLLQEFDLKYSADILGGIVDAAKTPATEEIVKQDISALDYFLKAYEARKANNFSEAEALYREAIKVDPGSSMAYNNLGNVLRILNRHEEAEAAHRKAIQLDSGNPAAYNNLGNVLRMLNRYEEAEAAYHKAIEIDPNVVDPYQNLCNLLRLRGREKEALKIAEDIHLRDTKNFARLIILAALHKNLNHEAEASAYAEKAREVAKPGEWYDLACLESVCGDTDAAIENLRRAAEQPGFNPEWARVDPDFEWIRDDPRFKEIVGEAGA
jgi:tetratricopeptide (TPR) repeat protein/NAD-dependent SIR2 family protein deacetylase